jgi:hypothetical protein
MQVPVITKQIFQEEDEYFLVEIQADGKIQLKRKLHGWSDIWSLPLEVVNR